MGELHAAPRLRRNDGARPGLIPGTVEISASDTSTAIVLWELANSGWVYAIRRPYPRLSVSNPRLRKKSSRTRPSLPANTLKSSHACIRSGECSALFIESPFIDRTSIRPIVASRERNMDLGISGRVAFVSGGSRGLGRATAELLAREGARVVIAARTQATIDETVDGIRNEGGAAAGVAVDMTTAGGIEEAVRFAQEAFGPPDIAIANVHSPRDGHFLEVDEADFHSAFQGLTISIALLARAVLPHMKQQRWGRFVNLGSGSAKEPPRELRHILGNTARASGVTLCKSLANEFGPFGVTVNSIQPGVHLTDRLSQLHPGAVESLAKAVPAGEIGDPRDFGRVAAFLCSEHARFVTGAAIPVDGGQYQGLQ